MEDADEGIEEREKQETSQVKPDAASNVETSQQAEEPPLQQHQPPMQQHQPQQQEPQSQQQQHTERQTSDSAEEGLQASLSALMYLLANHEDKQAAVAAALTAVLSVPRRQAMSAHNPPEGGVQHDQEGGMCKPLADLDLLDGKAEISPQSANEDHLDPADDAASKAARALREELAQALNPFPRCKHLISLYRTALKIPNKTPLSILHEYATRLNLELTFSESAESNAGQGPFTVEAHVRSIDDEDVFEPGVGKGNAKKMARQLAAAAVLERLVEAVGVHDIIGKQHKPEPKEPQVFLRTRGPPPPNHGPPAPGYGGRPGGQHARRPPRNPIQEHYGPPGYQQYSYGPQGGYTRQPQRTSGPLTNRPPHMRNSPASGWPNRAQPPPPPPLTRPLAGSYGPLMTNMPDPRLPLQTHRPPYDPFAQEGGPRGLPDRGDPEVAFPLGSLPAPATASVAAADVAAMTHPMSHPMPGSASLGSAMSYASSYLLDPNLGLKAGPQMALDPLPLAPLSSASPGTGLGYDMGDLGSAAAGENLMGVANRQADVDSYVLAQLRAHIGRIAAKSGVPVNPKHAQVVAYQEQLLGGVPAVDIARLGAEGTPLDGLSQSFYSVSTAGNASFPEWPPT